MMEASFFHQGTLVMHRWVFLCKFDGEWIKYIEIVWLAEQVLVLARGVLFFLESLLSEET